MIVFVHGLGCDWSDFIELASQMDEKEEKFFYKVPKLRANTISSLGDHLPAMARSLIERLQNETQVHIIAHSMGSTIAIPAAFELGAAVKSLTLLEANLIGDDCRLLSRSLSSFKTDTEVKEFIQKFRASVDKYERRWAAQASAYDPILLIEHAWELVQISESEDMLNLFLSLQCNTRYVFGDDYLGREILARLDEGKLIHVPTAGHFLPVQCATECAQIVSEMRSNALY